MSRLISILVTFLAISILSGRGVAQMAPVTPVKPGAPVSDQADVLYTLENADPVNTPKVKEKLWLLTNGKTEGGMRGGHPADAEKAQIAASPSFAQAFDRAPVATLALLRWVNRDIRQAQSKAAAR